jgi:methanogenic corrinoid protein MtbC1
MAKYQNLANSIIKGDNVTSKDITQKLVDDGVAAAEILNEGLVPGYEYSGTEV